MCFNGAKTYQLNWYSQFHVDLPINKQFNWSGNLIGFAEKASASIDDKMIIRIIGPTKDFYVHFNRKVGMNNETQEGGDQVLVAWRSTGLGYAQSHLVAKMRVNSVHTILNFDGTGISIFIQVNSIDTETVPGRASVVIEMVTSAPSSAHQTYDHITPQENPHMPNERKSGYSVRPESHYHPSRTSTRTHIKENMFRKDPSFQTSKATTSRTLHEFQNRIVGGIPAVADEFKFFAWLYVCGGSLIAPNIILTSAQCAGYLKRVRIGSNEVDSGGSVNSVVTECMHPDYNRLTYENDFMLVKLKNPVDTNTYPTVQLNKDTNVPQVDQLLTVIGFGYTSEEGSLSSTLLKVEVPANSHQECNRQYNGYNCGRSHVLCWISIWRKGCLLR